MKWLLCVLMLLLLAGCVLDTSTLNRLSGTVTAKYVIPEPRRWPGEERPKYSWDAGPKYMIIVDGSRHVKVSVDEFNAVSVGTRLPQ